MTIKYQTYQVPTLSAPRAGLVRRIAGGLNALWQAQRNRRQIATLAHFNEHMLRDIGLTQADVDFALQQPMWSDPSDELVKAAQSRRRYRFRR